MPEEPRDEVARIELKHDGKRWWVFRPPMPHVSLAELKRCLALYQQGFTPHWWAKASAAQRKHAEAVERKARSLEVLQSGLQALPKQGGTQ